jgi:hypothetical protein
MRLPPTVIPVDAWAPVTEALGLPPGAPVSLRVVHLPSGADALRLDTAGGVVVVELPDAIVADLEYDLWEWVLARLRERGGR